MKVLSLILVVFFAQVCLAEDDDLGLKFKSMCEGKYVQSLMGKTGSCHVVISPKPVRPFNMSCKTSFTGVPCEAKIDVATTGYSGKLSFSCTAQDGSKVMENEQISEMFSYDVTAYITTPSKKIHLIRDPKEYLEASSGFLDVSMTRYETVNQLSVETDLFLSFLGMSLKLKDVTCE